LIYNNEGLRVGKGHYDAKNSEKVGKAKEKRSWSLQKLLSNSPSEPPTRLKFQQSSP